MDSKQNINSPKVVAISPCGVIDMPSTEGVLNIKDMKEIWKDVPGYGGYYQASNLGRVRSLDRVISEHNGKLRPLKGRVLKSGMNKKGYYAVAFSKNGIVKNFRIHRLVAISFIENPLNLPEINHKDEIKANNHFDNLEWCTHLYNIRHGTGIKRGHIAQIGRPNIKNSGEGCGTSKLKKRQVIAIYKDQRKYRQIKDDYKISFTQISRIKNKKEWKHILNN